LELANFPDNTLELTRLSWFDADDKSDGHAGDVSGQSTPSNFTLTDEEDLFSDPGKSRNNRKYRTGLSCSDAEIEYRRGRSLREYRGDLSWH